MPRTSAQSPLTRRLKGLGPVGVSLSYVAVALTWILVSDQIVERLFADTDAVQSLKGAMFVGVTGVALFFLVKASNLRAQDLMGRVREVAENSSDGFWRWDVERDEICVTLGGDRDLGWEAAHSITSMATWRDVVHPDDWPRVEAAVTPVMNGAEEEFAVDHRISAIDGGWIWYRVRGHVGEGAGVGGARVMVGSYTNVDAVKRHELALRRANRALDTLVAVNRVSLMARDRTEILDGVCREVAQIEDVVLVWIGEAMNDDGRTIEPIAAHGPASTYLKAAEISWVTGRYGAGPAGQAVRTGIPIVVPDARECGFAHPWQERLEEYEIRSTLAVPFAVGTRRFVLQINSRHADEFGEEENDAYEALAQDMARALTHLDATEGYEQRLRISLKGAVSALAATVEKRDPYTAGHQNRVGELAAAIAREMKLSDNLLEAIRLGGAMHDIGKIGVPVEILTKPGRLNDVEMALIRRHPEIGHEIVKEIDFGWPIADIVRQHHERLDGSGYPLGLKADEISLEAKVVAVADVVESMATHRPYRAALSREVLIEELTRGRGVIYDADAVDATLRILEQVILDPQSGHGIMIARPDGDGGQDAPLAA